MSMTVEQAGLVFATPAAYADEPTFHEACRVLREHDPVHYVHADGFNPFWAVTKHADVFEIEVKPDLFHNAPKPVLGTAADDQRREENGDMLRTLIHMDAPDHPLYRRITADWFLPKSLARLDARVEELAKRYVDKMLATGGRCDFVKDVSVHYPLHVILSILGLPETDYERMLVLTQQLFGAADPEMSRGLTPEDLQAVIMDFFTYFTALTNERRARPTDDLASVIANAELDGRPLNDLEAISYYVIVATAGHDTTSSAIAGGLQALIENPDQLERLKADPTLINTAVDEMIRWVTPVKHFMRTATVDYELRGKTIKQGECVLLSYPSANRDADVFEDPFKFDVGRTPNKMLSFGFGVHYCLGAQLARMEMRAFFAELLPRLKSIELDGDPALMHTLFVGGLKRLPVRFEMA
jgi:cytochrome P450